MGGGRCVTEVDLFTLIHPSIGVFWRIVAYSLIKISFDWFRWRNFFFCFIYEEMPQLAESLPLLSRSRLSGGEVSSVDFISSLLA